MAIPKIIHTFWFSEDGSIPDNIQRCIQSQRDMAAKFGYEHNLVTLENYPLFAYNNTYAEQCCNSPYKNKKWVKLTDYLRMLNLYYWGGWTLDADVEILEGKSFDSLLKNTFVVGDEGIATIPGSRILGTAILGSEKGHPLVSKWIQEVESNFRGDDDKCYESSMDILNKVSFLYDDITIVPPDLFYPENSQTGEIKITGNTICHHHFNKSWVIRTDTQIYENDTLPTVSIIIPHIVGTRQEGLGKCIDSILGSDYPQELIEIVPVVGEDTVPEKVKKGVEMSTGEYICFAADDMMFNPDSLKEAIRVSKKYNKGLVAFNSGPLLEDCGNACEHFIIRRDLIDRLEGKEVFSTDFYHTGSDNWLMVQGEKMREYIYAVNAEIQHHHFSKGAEFDGVYEKGWKHVEKDRETLRYKLATL